MAEPNRLFFALLPDDATRAACEVLARDLKLRMQPGGYPVNALRYHLTLLFLGDFVTPQQEETAIEVAHRVSSEPFMLSLDQAMSFRNREIPWVLVPRQAPVALQLLHDRLRQALRDVGVLPDRMRFAPHLTVLRNAGQVLPVTQVGPLSWPVREFVLIRSVLHRQPARYEVIGRWPLAGTGHESKAPAQMNLWEN